MTGLQPWSVIEQFAPELLPTLRPAPTQAPTQAPAETSTRPLTRAAKRQIEMNAIPPYTGEDTGTDCPYEPLFVWNASDNQSDT